MTDKRFEDVSDQWLAALKAARRTSARYPGAPPISVSTPLYGLRATLATTMRRYLAQIALSLRPGSVAIADTSLRHLATYLVGHHREVQCVRELRRTHIDGFKAWLANRGGYRGKPAPAPTTIGILLHVIKHQPDAPFFDLLINHFRHNAHSPDSNRSGIKPGMLLFLSSGQGGWFTHRNARATLNCLDTNTAHPLVSTHRHTNR